MTIIERIDVKDAVYLTQYNKEVAGYTYQDIAKKLWLRVS